MTQANKLASTDIRVAVIRGAAMKAAIDGNPVFYRDLGGMIEAHSGSGPMNDALTKLMEENHGAKEPFYSSMVISSVSGMPSDGFFKTAGALGYPISETSSDVDKFKFWREQVKACHNHVFSRANAQSKKRH